MLFSQAFYAFLGFVLVNGGSTDVTAYNVEGDPWFMTRYARNVGEAVRADIAPMLSQPRIEVRFPEVPFAQGIERDAVYAALASCGMAFNDATIGPGGEEALARERRARCASLAGQLYSACEGDMLVARAIGLAAVSITDTAIFAKRLTEAGQVAQVMTDPGDRIRIVVATLCAAAIPHQDAFSLFPELGDNPFRYFYMSVLHLRVRDDDAQRVLYEDVIGWLDGLYHGPEGDALEERFTNEILRILDP